MTVKTWTATADFESADAETTYLDDAIITRHQGNLDGAGLSSSNMPLSTGTTKSGWTFTLEGSGTSTASIHTGVIATGALGLTIKRENSDTKGMSFFRATTGNILKNSTFEIGAKIYINSYAAAENQYLAAWGLFSSSHTGVDGWTRDSIHCRFAQGSTGATIKVGLHAWDSDQTVDSGVLSGSVINVNTWYWYRISGDGTTIALDVYSTEELYNAAGNGDVNHQTITVADISGTITADRFGWRNCAQTGVTDDAFILTHWLDADVCNWYADAEASCVDHDFSGITLVDYSTFAINTTGTGTVKFDVRKKETAEGDYTVYNNSGSHFTDAEIRALDDENLYGLGLVAYLDVTPSPDTTLSLDDVAVNYTSDTTAPALLGAIDLAALTGDDLPEVDDVILVWAQGTDNEGGSGFLCHFLIDEDAGGENRRFIRRVADGSNGYQGEWEDYENLADYIDWGSSEYTPLRYFNADKGAESTGEYDNDGRSKLIDGHVEGKIYKIASVDAAGNISISTFPTITTVNAAASLLFSISGCGEFIRLSSDLIERI